ncbi:MAG: SDR family NAD(P)-dependent oxidoreductase [Deltaproteobacteria bacterium]|nr:SDR family NAD(P)-dependent oxidoreductase [Deltaproteobacteria bacterium]
MTTADFRSRYGPRAIVAGAAVGLGAEYARQLAGRGLDLLLIDRDAAPLAATAAEIRAAHRVDVATLAADLARADIAAVVREAVGGGEIGLLVYNAAVGTVAPFLELTPAHCDAMLDVNCHAPMRLIHLLAPAMVARRRGGIVLMSSMSGYYGSAQLAVYAATKAFDLVLGDALWFELRPHGVDVLTVQPGSTRTPGWLSSQREGDDAPSLPVMEPPDVVRAALDGLGVEPNIVPGELNQQGAAAMRRMSRRDAIEMMSMITGQLVRNDR